MNEVRNKISSSPSFNRPKTKQTTANSRFSVKIALITDELANEKSRKKYSSIVESPKKTRKQNSNVPQSEYFKKNGVSSYVVTESSEADGKIWGDNLDSFAQKLSIRKTNDKVANKKTFYKEMLTDLNNRLQIQKKR